MLILLLYAGGRCTFCLPARQPVSHTSHWSCIWHQICGQVDGYLHRERNRLTGELTGRTLLLKCAEVPSCYFRGIGDLGSGQIPSGSFVVFFRQNKTVTTTETNLHLTFTLRACWSTGWGQDRFCSLAIVLHQPSHTSQQPLKLLWFIPEDTTFSGGTK